jgi:hypothetical protein
VVLIPASVRLTQPPLTLQLQQVCNSDAAATAKLNPS